MVTKLEKLLIGEVSGVDDPANMLPGFMVTKAKIRDRAFGPDNTDWDVVAAEARIREFTKATDGPNPAYASCFMWYDAAAEDANGDGVPDQYGAYKFLVCDVADGEIVIMPSAVRAAANRAPQASIPDSDRDALLGAISSLEEKAGVAKAAPEDATSIMAKIRQLVFPVGKAVDMTKDELMTELDARDERLVAAIVEKLAPKPAEDDGSTEAAAEAAAAKEGVTKEAEGESAEGGTEVVYLTKADFDTAVGEALAPYNEILEKVLERVENVETTMTGTARKSLEGQDDGPDNGGAAGNTEPKLEDAIKSALSRARR